MKERKIAWGLLVDNLFSFFDKKGVLLRPNF